VKHRERGSDNSPPYSIEGITARGEERGSTWLLREGRELQEANARRARTRAVDETLRSLGERLSAGSIPLEPRTVLVAVETAGEVGTREGYPFGGREKLWRRKAHECGHLKHGDRADDGKARERVIKP
jgi:hypothetical protein